MSRSRQRHHGDLEEYAECMRDILTSEPRNGLPSQPTRLLDYVYIGCQAHAESLKTLDRFKITHVLNCAGYKGPRPGPNASPYIGINIEYKEFQAEDSEDYDISQHFYEACKYLDSIRRKGGVALVHCQLGVNRSGAVCVAYLMHAERLTLLEATRLIKAKRSLVLSNRGFHMRLVRFAHSRGLLDPHVESHRSRIEREQAGEDAKLKESLNAWNADMGYTMFHFSSYDDPIISRKSYIDTTWSSMHMTPRGPPHVGLHKDMTSSSSMRCNQPVVVHTRVRARSESCERPKISMPRLSSTNYYTSTYSTNRK